MADHHWTKDDKDEWILRCEIKKQNFERTHPAWMNFGKCPFCGANALVEIEARKKEKQDKENITRLEEAKKKNIKAKNTLTGYM